MWQLVDGIATRRNAYAGTNKVDAQTLGQILDRSVKIDGRVGPLNITGTMMRRIGAGDTEPAAVVAAQASAAMFQDYLNTTAACLVAAIGANADVVLDVTAGSGAAANITMQNLNKVNAKMGDRSQQIRAYIMHSTAFHSLIDQAINNTEHLFQIGDLNVYKDFLGRRYVVSDIPSLVDGAGASAKYRTLGLTPSAAIVQVGGLYDQGEYDFNVSLKGYSWVGHKAGQSPTDEDLAAQESWSKVATSNKDTAGVMLLAKSAI
ncbi:major head capsid protein [Salmonella phage SPHG1]|nr:major head capsid protein [Salmonella phage SPHG1]